MLNSNSINQFKQDHPNYWNAGLALGVGALSFTGTLAVLTIAQSSAFQNLINGLLAANSVQAMWYVTRAAGFVSYLLFWFSTVLGLAIPTRLFDRILPRAATYDFHQFISLLGLGFIGLHIGVLLIDRYLPYTLAQILVPFISPYRPVWVGVGVFAFYLALLVTITTYMRSRIGLKAFKVIHAFSLVSFLGVVVHSILSGSDNSLPAVQWLYGSTSAVVAIFTVYWMVRGGLKNLVKKPAAR
jgi:methionine sulfoxide reductase heme-binding subunit